MRSKSMRVSNDFLDMINEIRKQFRIKNNVEATRFIAKNKIKLLKGSILDFFPFLLILFIFGICSMVAYTLMVSVENQASPVLGNQSAAILHQGTVAISYLDDMFIFLVFGIAISMIIAGFYLNTHPVFIPIGIFMLVFVLLVSGIFSNIFVEFANVGMLSDSAVAFSITISSWKNMPFIVLMIAVILMIVMFARPQKESGSGGFT
jgi:hypothetical protein